MFLSYTHTWRYDQSSLLDVCTSFEKFHLALNTITSSNIMRLLPISFTFLFILGVVARPVKGVHTNLKPSTVLLTF